MAARRTLARFALAFFIVITAACGGDDPTGPGEVASVQVVTPGTLERGESGPAQATVRDRADLPAGAAVTWSSDAPEVATVNPTSGVITAVGKGTANIRATAGGVTGQAPVTVHVLYRSITAGGFSTCDLSSGGVAHCW